MDRATRIQFSCAAVFGMTAVAAGALGAHALTDILAERNMTAAWETAVVYHLSHTVALLCLAIWSVSGRASPTVRWASGLMAGGILLFSGSIYGLALGGPSLLGPMTPIGGVLFIASWAMVLVAACNAE